MTPSIHCNKTSSIFTHFFRRAVAFVLLLVPLACFANDHQFYDEKSGVVISGLSWVDSIDSQAFSDRFTVFKLNPNQPRFFATGALVDVGERIDVTFIIDTLIDSSKSSYPDIAIVESQPVYGEFKNLSVSGVLVKAHFTGSKMKLCDTYVAYQLPDFTTFVLTLNSPVDECLDRNSFLMDKIAEIVAHTSIEK